MLKAICFRHVADVECGGTDCVRPAQRGAGKEAGTESSLASFSPVFRQHYIPSDSGKARLKAELRYRLEIKKKERGSHCRATHDMQVLLQEFLFWQRKSQGAASLLTQAKATMGRANGIPRPA